MKPACVQHLWISAAVFALSLSFISCSSLNRVPKSGCLMNNGIALRADEFIHIGVPTRLLGERKSVPISSCKGCNVPPGLSREWPEILSLLARIPSSGSSRQVKHVICWESYRPVAAKVEMSDFVVFLTKVPSTCSWAINRTLIEDPGERSVGEGVGEGVRKRQ